MTGFTFHHRRNADFRFSSVCSLFQRNFEVVAQIRATMHIGTPATPSATKNISKNITESVTKSLCTSAACISIHTGMAKLIVGSAFMRIRQDFVGLFGFFKHLLRFNITRIPIRVIFHSQLAIGFLDGTFIGIAADTEHFIVIALTHIDFLLPG